MKTSIKILLCFLLSFLSISAVAVTWQTIKNGLMQTPLNAGGHSITNLGGLYDPLGEPFLNEEAVTELVNAAVAASSLDGVSVKASPYNATGDWVTDDTSAIQSCLNAGNTNVLIPAGNFLVTTLYVTNRGVRISGIPGQSFLRQKTNTGGTVLVVTNTDCVLDGIWVDGNRGTTSYKNPTYYYPISSSVFGTNTEASRTNHGLVFNGQGKGLLRDVTVTGFSGYGMDVTGDTNILARLNYASLERVTVTNCWMGLRLRATNATEYINIKDSQFYLNWIGVGLGSANIDWSGGFVRDANVGIWANPGSNGRMHTRASFTINHCAVPLYVQDSGGLHVNGAQILGDTQVFITNSTACIFSGNFFELGAGVREVLNAGQVNFWFDNVFSANSGRTWLVGDGSTTGLLSTNSVWVKNYQVGTGFVTPFAYQSVTNAYGMNSNRVSIGTNLLSSAGNGDILAAAVSNYLSGKLTVAGSVSLPGETTMGSIYTPALGGSAVGLSNANATLLFGSGTVPTARLGSGSASASTYLRGDQSWASVPEGLGVVAGTNLVGETNSGVVTISLSPTPSVSSVTATNGGTNTLGATVFSTPPIGDGSAWTNLQLSIATGYPWTGRNAGLITDGDSLNLAASGLYHYLTNNHAGWRLFSAVSNCAVSGNNMSQIAARFDTDVAVAVAAMKAAGITNIFLLFDAGANGLPTDWNSTFTDWTNYIARAQASNVTVITVSVLPQTPLTDISVTNWFFLNRAMRQCPLPNYFADWARILPDPVDTQWFADGTHPTAAGYTRVAEYVDAIVRGLKDVPSDATESELSATNRVLFSRQGNPVVTLTDSGRVGVGQRNPTSAVHIGSVWKLNSDGSAYWGSAAAHGKISWDGSAAQVGGFTGQALQILANNTAHASLLANGNFGVGTTSPTNKLQVMGNIESSGMVYANNASFTNNLTVGGMATASTLNTATPAFKSLGTNNVILRCPDGGSFILRIDNAGTISTTTNSSNL